MQSQDSVIRRLLIIAEAARRVSDTTKLKFPAIAWHEINGMRIDWFMNMMMWI